MSKLAEKQEVMRMHEEAQAPVPAKVERDEPASLLAVISRAASDPNCDVEKMRALLDMKRELDRDGAKAAYTKALIEMKPHLPVIERRGKIIIRDKANRETIIQSTPYALWEDIDEAITPTLHDYGFALSFRTGVAQDGKITVTGVLSHVAEGAIVGHSEETTITLPHDSSGSKNNVQAVGSSTAYGKRYTATLLLNLRTKGEDDDGLKAGEPEMVSEEQRDDLIALADEVGADKAKFCAYLKVPSLADIPAAQFQRAMDALEAKRKKAS